MFEQNGNCGYVLKPNVYWDKEHSQYAHFNPSVIEREGSCFELTIAVSNVKKNENVYIYLMNVIDYFWSIFNAKYWLNNKLLC